MFLVTDIGTVLSVKIDDRAALPGSLTCLFDFFALMRAAHSQYALKPPCRFNSPASDDGISPTSRLWAKRRIFPCENAMPRSIGLIFLKLNASGLFESGPAGYPHEL